MRLLFSAHSAIFAPFFAIFAPFFAIFAPFFAIFAPFFADFARFWRVFARFCGVFSEDDEENEAISEEISSESLLDSAKNAEFSESEGEIEPFSELFEPFSGDFGRF
jgi:CBS domain containing-hemolysin-like protein